MKLTKTHSVLKFKQSDWMKIYINFNTKKKTLVIILKKNIFKLIINSVYGKTIENLRNRINVRLVNSAKYYKKYVCKPSFFS